MDLKYQQRVSDEAIEQRWSSLPLSGPEDHHLVQWWTTWNRMAEALEPDGSRYRAVFLNLVSKYHAAIVSPQGCGNEDGNIILEKEAARGEPFTATQCYNFILQRASLIQMPGATPIFQTPAQPVLHIGFYRLHRP